MWFRIPHQQYTLIFLVIDQEVVFEKIVKNNEKAKKFIETVNTFERNYNYEY